MSLLPTPNQFGRGETLHANGRAVKRTSMPFVAISNGGTDGGEDAHSIDKSLVARAHTGSQAQYWPARLHQLLFVLVVGLRARRPSPSSSDVASSLQRLNAPSLGSLPQNGKEEAELSDLRLPLPTPALNMEWHFRQ